MKHWTLRTRITLWSGLVNTTALLVFGVVAATVLYFRLEHSLDRRLAEDAQVFLRDFRKHNGRVDLASHDPLVRFKTSTRLLFYAAGPRSGPLGLVFPERYAPLLQPWPLPPGMSTARFEGKRIRLGVVAFDETIIVVASDLHSLDETVLSSLGAFLLALPLVLLAVALGSAWVARRSLQPITELTAAAARINTSSLDARIPESTSDDEIGRHVRVLNEMFARLQRGFEQANRFTADASHELRTPLTILRGELEQTLRSGAITETQERATISLLEQVDRLQKITTTLLLLARFDAGKTPLHREKVDLSRLVAEGAEDAELLAARNHIEVAATIQPEVGVSGDPLLLRRVIINLVDNAIRHNRHAGRVHLALQRDEATGTATFTIANTGPGIPPDRHVDLFKRFFRLSSDRNRETGGSGLGLSLCREIITAHGGQIFLSRCGPDDTAFTVSLPAAPR